MSPSFGRPWRPVVAAILRRHGQDPERLLQILVDVQEALHGVPDEVAAWVAGALPGVTPLSAQALVRFYAFLSPEFLGEYVIRLGDSVTDRMRGGQDLARDLCARLGVGLGQVRDDGRVSVHLTACTGMADQGPAGLVNGRPLTRLDPGRIAALAGQVAAGTPVSRWPQPWFRVRAQLRRAGPLLAALPPPGAALRAGLARGGGHLDRAAAAILGDLERSGLRGRGGAGFPVAAKWRAAREAPGSPRTILCNADEGEPGTFKDRLLLQACPDLVFEGMTLAGLCVGAEEGILYLRGEYRFLGPRLAAVLARRRRQGLLGPAVLGSPLAFGITLHWGAGAYICGMETALLESVEGRPGIPRTKWPLPVLRGHRGGPSVVNNVESFAAAARVVLGAPEAAGFRLYCASGDCARPGVYEFPVGVRLRELLAACGAGPVQAVQANGPSGRLVGPAGLDRRMSFQDLPGVGSLMVFGPDRDLLEVVLGFARFFRDESCGLCTPCRVGTALVVELLEKFRAGRGSALDLERLRDLGGAMAAASHCGLGQAAPAAALDLADQFPGILGRSLAPDFRPDFDVAGFRL